MNILKAVSLIVIVIVLGWMNLTPGHFQNLPCGCTVGYLTTAEYQRMQNTTCAVMGLCLPAQGVDSIKNSFLAGISIFDLTK